MTIQNHLIKLLDVSRKELKKGKRLIEKTGKVNAKGDHTIGMDTNLENLFIKYLRSNNIPADIFSEEIGLIKYEGAAKYFIVFDPLDGSTNYAYGREMLPYGSLFAIYEAGEPSLNKILAAGAYEATQDITWVFDGKKTTNLMTNEVVQINKSVEINKKTSVYIDLYYQEAFQRFEELSGKLHIRWNGSNISSLLYVLTGVASVMGAVGMRGEEIGAMVGLISGAGGEVKKTDGSELTIESFHWDKTYPLLAGVKNVVEFMARSQK